MSSASIVKPLPYILLKSVQIHLAKWYVQNMQGEWQTVDQDQTAL